MAPTVNDSPGARLGVVVGVDGTRTALDAVRWAAVEAQLRGLPLQILHAAPYTADHTRPGLRRAHDILARAFTVARRTHPELPVATNRTEDTPVCSLLDVAERAELLVLGMSGGERFPEAFVHSVVLDVCGRAPCPVVVVRGASTRRTGDTVVGVDSPVVDAAALEAAFTDAKRHGGRVVVVHALHGAGPFRDHLTGHDQSAHDAALARLSDQLAPLTSRYSDVEVQLEVVHEQPVAALFGAAVAARLLVVGPRSRGAAARALFGSTSHEVLRCCPVPVMVVNPVAAGDAVLASTSTVTRQERNPHDRSELW
ncbi:universal stress protein [Pseudonocardia alaniniphila]|uniref:Universal stress protein n=1 Tax=Pseudonocardia alaniniphila TaxID=75291 RepID=A0ABS9TGJ3_9PSEU|nr:universal stress protein [Pseudonocardia alaniniphila]MCH6167664.1 universal stress protein [Pseudonocardia alaniniphila]